VTLFNGIKKTENGGEVLVFHAIDNTSEISIVAFRADAKLFGNIVKVR
jgi:hypothetical protein